MALLPVAEALERLIGSISPLPAERVALEDASGRFFRRRRIPPKIQARISVITRGSFAARTQTSS